LHLNTVLTGAPHQSHKFCRWRCMSNRSNHGLWSYYGEWPLWTPRI